MGLDCKVKMGSGEGKGFGSTMGWKMGPLALESGWDGLQGGLDFHDA